MKSLKIAFLSLSVTLAASAAQAGLLLEPYLGYGFGTVEAKQNSGATAKSTLTMPVLGGRVGYEGFLVHAAIDYSLPLGGTSKGDSGGAEDADISGGSSLFAVVGVHIPLFRFWGGYGIIYDLTLKDDGAETTYKGTALKAGVGFTGLPFVALNLEYIMGTTDKLKTSSGETSVSDLGYSSVKSNLVLLSVSMPFDL